MSSLPGSPALLPPMQAESTAITARVPPLAGSQTVPLALPPGSRVVAEVVQSQTDGQVLLRLGQTVLAATLPGDHPVGSQLSLVVLNDPGTPPVLLLAPSTGDQGANPAVQAKLSNTAQLLGDLQQPGAAPQSVRGAAPVWQAAQAPDAPGLARALAQSVKTSGLFYESHLAAWVQGQASIPELLAEPQGQLSPRLLQGVPLPLAEAPAAALATVAGDVPGAAAAAAPTQSQASPPPPPGALQSAAPLAVPGPDARAPSSAGGETPRVAQHETPQAAPVHPGKADATAQAAATPGSALRARQALDAYAGVQAQTVQTPASAQLPAQLQALVQQQLATLAQGAVAWAGQVWPGQDMQWRIEPDAEEQAGNAPAQPTASRGWTSVIRLDLPHLGPLVATIHMRADEHVSVHLQHAAAVAPVLGPRRDALRQAVQDAGLKLDEVALQATRESSP